MVWHTALRPGAWKACFKPKTKISTNRWLKLVAGIFSFGASTQKFFAQQEAGIETICSFVEGPQFCSATLFTKSDGSF
jgi:hypothetical protein